MSAEQPQLEKSLIKKLLHENRLSIDNQLVIINLSDEKKFKLLLHSTEFDPSDFSIEIQGKVLIIKAHCEEKELDDKSIVKQNLAYAHELPDDVDPKKIEAFFPMNGYLEVEAPRKN